MIHAFIPKEPPLKTNDIVTLYDRCFRIERVMFDEDGDTLIVAECLEPKKNETPWWHFPVNGMRGLREFAASTKRVVN